MALSAPIVKETTIKITVVILCVYVLSSLFFLLYSVMNLSNNSFDELFSLHWSRYSGHTVIFPFLILDLVCFIYIMILLTNFHGWSRMRIGSIILFGTFSTMFKLVSLQVLTDVYQFPSWYNHFSDFCLLMFLLTAGLLSAIFVFLASVAFFIISPKPLIGTQKIILLSLAVVSLIVSVLSLFSLIFPLFTSVSYFFWSFRGN